MQAFPSKYGLPLSQRNLLTIMNELNSLYKKLTGSYPDAISSLSASGSNRKYFRLAGVNRQLIGVEGTSAEENKAFLYMVEYFKKKNIPVPEVLITSDNQMFYLQEDLGDVLLFDFIANGRKTGQFNVSEKEMLHKTIALLPEIQVKGAEDFDFSVCYPQSHFNERSVFWDLNYFKYNFLKTTGIDFQEDKLEDDFVRFAEALLKLNTSTFMYRDFQSRNVMIHNNNPYFIDFQGGRKGPLAYDVASFLWQAKARFGDELREELLQTYLNALQKLIQIDEKEFRSQLKHFVLFRTLQVLGAYGFRGYFEKKVHFLESIPFAIDNLKRILQDSFVEYPYLVDVLKRMTDVLKFEKPRRDNLLVKVYSFSYKKGIPDDDSGNGGGFVFDCRAVNNPGRSEQFAPLTGLDEPVINFLEEDGEISKLLENAFELADTTTARYLDRGFTSLMICFGCTGGRHRSVYAAQKMAEHIHRKFGCEVQLIHREQQIEQHFKLQIPKTESN